MVEFLPIIMFKQRSDDNQRIEGGGGDNQPGWYLAGDELLAHSDELASSLLDRLATARKNPSLPYLFEVFLDSDDTSKTKRRAVAGMLEVSETNERPNIIGMRGSDSLIVQAQDEETICTMAGNIRDTKRNVAGISCVEKVVVFKPEVSLVEAEGSYKVKLVDYQDNEVNNACQSAFEVALEDEFVDFKV